MRLLIAAALILAMPAVAQDAVKPNAGVVVVRGADLAQKLATVPTSTTITTTDKYISLLSHRTVDGTPERHANWTDVMVMLHGEVTLTTGGTISGNTVDANGESHGGTLTGGTTVVLHEGDYLEVPAGMPHLMTAPRGDFRYFVTKVHV
jgi:hypothetical protein